MTHAVPPENFTVSGSNVHFSADGCGRSLWRR
jgi:hypothetical protein